MTVFDLFGRMTGTLEDARSWVEGALGVSLQARKSSYIGDYYGLQRGQEELILRMNVDPEDEKPAESKFPEYPILLYVSYPRDPSSTREALERAGFTALRHKEHVAK
jgi:hypothetical protein